MVAEFIIGGAEGRNPDVDNAYQFEDSEGNVFKLKALTDSGVELLRNGVRTQPFKRVVAKTAAYTVLESDHGTLFTTEGASGSVTFTLPATANLPVGWFVEFFQAADQGMVIAAGTADTLVVGNDLAADSIAYSTAGEMIGNFIRVVKLTGTLVGVVNAHGGEAFTATIVTA